MNCACLVESGRTAYQRFTGVPDCKFARLAFASHDNRLTEASRKAYTLRFHLETSNFVTKTMAMEVGRQSRARDRRDVGGWP